ncbi:hypothetical protein AX16_009193 [Volvariella volvacea WC 439]|nr:hypothetical protein AX16_009193 [Volvariella volvacea WC 439]
MLFHFFFLLLCSILIFVDAAVIFGRRSESTPSSVLGCGVHIDSEEAARIEQRVNSHRVSPELFRAPNDTKPAEIEIHWHVFSANLTVQGGWVSEESITEQMRVLNENYLCTGFQFTVAQIERILDPRYHGGLTLQENDTLYFELAERYRVGGAEALNVYVVDLPGTLLGAATLPVYYEEIQYLDAVLIDYAALPGGSEVRFNTGKVLVHEVGHWLGLYHIFEGGCDAPGDYVDDTAPQKEPTIGCDFRSTCGVPPTPYNIMDYSEDVCMLDFTPGQIARMQQQTHRINPREGRVYYIWHKFADCQKGKYSLILKPESCKRLNDHLSFSAGTDGPIRLHPIPFYPCIVIGLSKINPIFQKYYWFFFIPDPSPANNDSPESMLQGAKYHTTNVDANSERTPWCYESYSFKLANSADLMAAAVAGVLHSPTVDESEQVLSRIPLALPE